ncbi:ABC transporter ATP-binding protein [Bacillus subtilis]|uniref:ABC transporter ATP-binding protein n=1 Tax=Pseudochrobactrum asaccharolyticum TaxID=354351 RepID=UPI001F434D14|nr:ABC transporter ATP-binding protein [Pseudochrobactrum asaccharolyticum]MCF7645560.1 ABC transporter ATP-binding protein [Pseudochrobactrum asaccharolyticum]MCF7672175.1 ABC transporter ATP-binding protein [Bacillus subtilis]
MSLPDQKQVTSPVLSVRNLTTAFNNGELWNPVVKGVSFDVNAGETVAIVGESGSGKSVTSLSIMGLLDSKTARISGEILLNGQNLLSLKEHQMRNLRGREMAMIFQEPMTSLNPVFTIGRQIAEALTCHGEIDARAAKAETLRLLDKVRIPNAASRFSDYPHQFSGGMRQRVMIAMALASRPKLLIADEPTTALDVTIQAQILDLIKTLQEEEGTSVLFITHDMGVVAETADRTVVMYRGEMVENGATADLFRHAAHPYTRALLSAVPHLGSMNGIAEPLPFPVIDMATGEKHEPVPVSRQVDMQTPILDIRNLTTRYHVTGGLLGKATGAVHAVENVSFQLFPGETLALVGESGCGKSSIGRTIMRLANATSGEILLKDEDLLNLNAEKLRLARRNVQMIFQDPFASLNPRMSVGNAIAEPLIQHGLLSKSAAQEKATALLERVGLSTDIMKRYPHEFSGGQRQRIAIARALALDPKVIVADEAVSALDVSIKAQVCNLMMDLQESFGLSYLFISHDMAVVERVSHRVAVMYLGEIVEIGPRSAVFENPQHPYTRKLMAAVPVLDPARRHMKRQLQTEELRSPIRPVGYAAPERQYSEITTGHFVMQTQ